MQRSGGHHKDFGSPTNEGECTRIFAERWLLRTLSAWEISSGLRQPDRNRVDLVHIRELEPLFIDGLLNFLESLQPFAPGLKPSMRMSLLELVQNFAEHSGSATGAWVSGHKYRNRITLCLLDLGKGIPTSLRGVDRYRRMRSDPHLIELATEPGVSAVATNRGRGLDVIRRFVRVNGGTMTIISGKGRVRFRPVPPTEDRQDRWNIPRYSSFSFARSYPERIVRSGG